MFFQNTQQLRKLAKSLLKNLRAKYPELTLGELLEALAHTKGYSSWAALNQALSPGSLDAMLSDAELSHAHDSAEADLRAEESGGPGYGDEISMQAHTGFFLKAPAHPKDCGYVRVCDPVGREVAYWVSDEWAQEPPKLWGQLSGP